MIGKSKKIRVQRLDDDTNFTYVYKFQLEAHMAEGWVECVGRDHVFNFKGKLQSFGHTNWFGKATAEKLQRIYGVLLDLPSIWGELTVATQFMISVAMASPVVALVAYFATELLIRR